MNEQICPKTWMAESILATIFCCLPLGIVGIVYAAKVNSLFAAGNYELAVRASNDAKRWTFISVIVGLVLFVVSFFMGAFSALLA